MSMLANLALASSILTSNVSTNLNTMNVPTNYDPGLIVETNLRTDSSSTYSDYVDSYINQELYSKGKATVTVLTHGMAGNSHDWLTKTENSYDTDSSYILPFSINNSLNYTGYFENEILKTNIFRFSYNSVSNSTILDRLVRDNNGNYSFNSNETINEIDIESHIILLYDGDLGSEERLVTNNECYNLFEESLDTILIGISLLQEDTLPKINLIGHSRGGLVNLEYAIKHKEIISNLISLGTPYSNGTKSTQGKNYIYDDWASFYNNIQKTQENFVSGYDDMLDNFTCKDQFNACKDYFNSYAIGFNQSYFYCLNTIISYFTKDNYWLNNFTQNLSNYTNNFISKEQFENILKELLNLLNDTTLKNFIKNFFEGAQNAADFVGFFANIFNSTDLENKCQKANKIFSDLCSIVSNDVFCKDTNKDSIIQSDICVNLDSQLGLTRTEDIYTKLSTPINILQLPPLLIKNYVQVVAILYTKIIYTLYIKQLVQITHHIVYVVSKEQLGSMLLTI